MTHIPIDDSVASTAPERRALQILAELAAHPAVPFFEAPVAAHIADILGCIADVSVMQDEFGNIIARFANLPEASAPESVPPIAFVAHMDHPGFEIFCRYNSDSSDAADCQASGTGDRFVARALGGVPAASLVKHTPVFVPTPDGKRIPAQLMPLAATDVPAAGASPNDRLACVRLDAPAALELPSPVVFDLPDFAIDDGTIRMRAADDLAGCAAILAALERLVQADAPTDFFAVFTRAEEGGLFGARLMAEAGTLPQDTIVVSVEASPIIPGVAQGEGPVIRTGDRVYTFDADAEQALAVAQARLQAQNPGFKAQRQLMSGGGCEATAFAVFGYSVTGLAFPLGNWHNATSSIPDPDGGIDSEYISVSDYLGGVALITEAATSVASRHDSPTRRRIRQIPSDVRQRMRATAG